MFISCFVLWTAMLPFKGFCCINTSKITASYNISLVRYSISNLMFIMQLAREQVSLKFLWAGYIWNDANHSAFQCTLKMLIWFLCITNLPYWSRDKMAAILRTTFSDTICWVKIVAIWFRVFISLIYVPKGPINNAQEYIQTMGRRHILIHV